MAPVVIIEDYYLVLQVDQSATAETIIKSYKKLAFQLHPDRNKKHDAKEAFQLLGQAYETLKDETERRNYDLRYPQIKSQSTARAANTSRPAPQNTPRTKQDEEDISHEEAGIAALFKAKAKRAAQWLKTRKVYDDAIFELERKIRKLQAAIRELENEQKAEDAKEAEKNSWTTWMWSPFYGKPVETEEEKQTKGRERIDRMHTTRFKERELGEKDEELRRWEEQLREKEREKISADEADDTARAVFERKRERVRMEKERMEREAREKAQRERMEKERIEREARQKAWREQQERERIEREAREKAQREEQEKIWRERREQEAAAKQRKKQADEAVRRRVLAEVERVARIMREQERGGSEGLGDARIREEAPMSSGRGSRGQSSSQAFSGFASPTRSACDHDYWWNKIEGRMSCESCGVFRYHYFLQCPGCTLKACPDCMQKLRPPTRNVNRIGGPSMASTRGKNDWVQLR